MTFYTENTLREMGPFRIWTELSLHKGYLGEHGPNKLYFIGQADTVGVLGEKYRMVLPLTNFDESIAKKLRSMDPKALWEGPVHLATASVQGREGFERMIAPARAYFNARLMPQSKKPTIKKKPQETIAYEDRPDVGKDTVYFTTASGKTIRRPIIRRT